MNAHRRRKKRPLITLLTDFGTRDVYVGVMKGVIAGIAPQSMIIDLTHEVPPQDVVQASVLLHTAWPYFPRGSIHVVVVDPGVGTSRRALLVEADGHFFIGPDNGVFTPVFENTPEHQVRSLEASRYALSRKSNTFHGRDVFAPAAAWLAQGVPNEAFGPLIDDPIQLQWPRVKKTPDGWQGEILGIDHFGNLITNLNRDELTIRPDQQWSLSIADHLLDGKKTYGDAKRGELLALVGGAGFIEVAVNGGSARDVLGVGKGTPVHLHVSSD